MLVIPVFAAYCFLFLFSTFFVVSLKLPKLHEPIRHRFGSHLCFVICNEKSEKPNKAKTPIKIKLKRLCARYHIVGKDG